MVSAAVDTAVVVAGDSVTTGGALSAVAWALIDGVGVGDGVSVGVGDGVTFSLIDVDGITDVRG